MKTIEILGQLSTAITLIPLLVIIALKLFKNKSFLALMIYYTFLLCYQMMAEGILTVPKATVSNMGLLFNFIDAPLILFFLLHFTTSKPLAHKITYTLYSLLVFEVITILIYGFTIKSIIIVLGPGIICILVFSFVILSRNIRLMIINHKNKGKTLMNMAILFAYSIYAILYVFFYLLDTPYMEDALLIYDLTLILSSIVLTLGILEEGKKFKKLKEVKRTRKELQEFFKDEKAVSFNRLTAFM